VKRYLLFSTLSALLFFSSVQPFEDWTFKSQRPEIFPKHWVEQDFQSQGKPGLALSGNDKEHANGCWTKTLPVVAGKSYKFSINYLANHVEEPNRSVLARVLWQDENGKRVGRAEYPRTLFKKNAQSLSTIEQVYIAPEKSAQAQLELVYRWDADGSVYFINPVLKETSNLAPRLVNIASIHYRPRNSKGTQDNLNKFAAFVDEAGKKGADIVCLPEGITLAGTGKKYLEVSEPVPGPSTEFLGKVAKKNNLYIVAGIYEIEGEIVYNTSVLLGRDGSLVGKYRKVCLPREEIQGGITPGKEFPVFDTDFGRIGMMICWDVFFPEPARALALKGAEIIFMPIWGGNLNLAKARAIENQIYLVSSTYGMKTGVFDLEGELIVEGTEDLPVAMVTVDLNQQKLWPWLGDLKNRIPRELPPQSSY
jgi:predicted amidohydrolase